MSMIFGVLDSRKSTKAIGLMPDGLSGQWRNLVRVYERLRWRGDLPTETLGP